ncbi:hypothetical protein C0W92_09180 [Photobacterium angustum]|uniref:DUF4405 domain-containing protein n=2 Tax=Photobacterium angustum TaxID=661 RepID=A0A855S9F1_PHOAN|nr:hypothetical protein C0W92_09180 [Photobacterium angustum]PSX05006.1 hypothetical protein C0W41_19200 [Photobacterium angustum]PSX15518.1 hypothetical protein C0W55_06040 [Photobacterium angustum]PSX24010.1 hypothetical protein C0W36_07340 [Photobacterium angustum]PSX40141.1 hypothetical protein C0W34_14425 [Photobacterium angustum]
MLLFTLSLKTLKVDQMKKYWTPLTLVCALLVLTSGSLLFLDINSKNIVLMHEWIGILMVIAVLGHAFLYKNSIIKHLSRKNNIVMMATILLLGIAMIQSDKEVEQSNNVSVALFDSIDNAPITLMSELTHQPINNLIDKIKLAGFTADDPKQSIVQIAQLNHQQPEDMISVIYKK